MSTDTGSSFWDDLSQILGKAASGAGSGRAAQGNYENARDNISARLYDIGQTAREHAATQNLADDKFRTSLPGVGAAESVRGSLMQNAQDAHLTGGGHITPMEFSGGTRPSSFTPATRQAGADLQAHGAKLMADPSSFVTQTPGSGVAGAGFMDTPKLSPELNPSFWEQAAGAGGITSGLLSALAKGGGASSGGDLGKAFAALKQALTGHGGGIDGSDNTEDTRTEDLRGAETSGVAFGPDGQPLPVQGGTDDAGGYYDDNGQYVVPYGGGGGSDDENWGDE